MVNASQTTSRPSTSFDLSVHNTHASSLASSLSAFLSEVPSVITVFEAGLLDAGSFCKTHAPVSYQTNFASDYYDQALNLQGEKVTLRQVIDHLLDQHPNGLISALSEMQEAISDGKQWKHICKVKVPVAMKASSDSPSIFTPVKQVPPQQLPSSPQLSLPSVFSSLRGESTSGVTPFTVPSSILHRTPSRTLSFLKRIGESTAGLQHQMPQQLEEVADTPTNDPPEYQFGVDAVILRELGMDELAADSAFDCVILEEDEVEDHIEPSHACLWHEVVVKPFVDPTSGKRLVMIQQNDVTLHLDLLINVSSEIDMASVCGKLSERQMALLSASFPRHVLEHLVDPLKLEQVSNSSNIMQSNMSEDFLMDLPTELDPSSKLLMRPCPKDMASIPSKGFEKLARSHQDVTILFMVIDLKSCLD